MESLNILSFLYGFLTISSFSAASWLTLTDEAILNGLKNSPNSTDPVIICGQIRGLLEKHKELCYRSPAIWAAIGEGNRRTLEHLAKVFEEDRLPASLLIYNSIFSFRIAEGSNREVVYLASIRTSAIAHELALACSDGQAEDVCPCYRPPTDTNPEFKSALGLPLVLDQGCPYALAHAQRIALDFILNDPDLSADARHMIKEHAIAAVKSIEAGWVDPEEEWERKLGEFEAEQSANLNGFGARVHGHGEL